MIEDGSIGFIDEEIDPDDIAVDRIMCFNVGRTVARPHLVVSFIFLLQSHCFYTDHNLNHRYFCRMVL